MDAITRDGAEFLFYDIAQRLTVAAHGDEQDHHVLYRTGKHYAEDNPQRTRQVTHLRSQYGTNQGACTGNRGKVVTEQHAFVCRHIVQTVIVPFGGREAVRIELHHVFGNVQAVETIGDAVDRYGGGYHPYRTDMFAAADGQGGEGG